MPLRKSRSLPLPEGLGFSDERAMHPVSSDPSTSFADARSGQACQNPIHMWVWICDNIAYLPTVPILFLTSRGGL